MKIVLAMLVLVVGGTLTPTGLRGATTFTGTSGTNSASLSFSVIGNSTLRVVLTNTTLAAATGPGDVLTGFFFSSPGVMTPASVTLGPGATLANCPSCAKNVSDISGEWFWGSNVSGLNDTPSFMLGETSFGFLSNTVGPNPVLPTRTTSGTLDFGLVSSNTSFGQAAFTGSPLVTKSLVFNFQFINNVSASSVTGGGFIWGNYLNLYQPTLDESSFAPEPASFGLMGAGVLAMLAIARRKVRRKQQPA